MAVGEQGERPARSDGGQLRGVAAQQHFAAGAAGLLDELDQVAGGDHGGLVDQTSAPWGSRQRPRRVSCSHLATFSARTCASPASTPAADCDTVRPQHLGAVVLPGGDGGAQSTCLARTRRAHQQPDPLWGAEQITDGVRLVGAQLMLEHRRVDDVAGGCAAGRLDSHVAQPGFLVQRRLERPPLPVGPLVHAGAVAASQHGRRVEHVWCGHAHQLRTGHRPGDQPLRPCMQLRSRQVAGWQDIERGTEQVVAGEGGPATGSKPRDERLQRIGSGGGGLRAPTEHLPWEAGKLPAVAAGGCLPRRQRVGGVRGRTCVGGSSPRRFGPSTTAPQAARRPRTCHDRPRPTVRRWR